MKAPESASETRRDIVDTTNEKTGAGATTIDSSHRPNRVLLVAAITVVAAVAIVLGVTLPSSTRGGDNGNESATTSPSSDPREDPNTSPVRYQMLWWLQAFNDVALVPPEDIDRRFSNGFRQDVGQEEVFPIFLFLRNQARGDIRVNRILNETETYLDVIMGEDTDDTRIQLQMGVSDESPYLIELIQFLEPEVEFGTSLRSFAELAGELGKFGTTSSYLAAEIVNGRCETIVGSHDEDQIIALGHVAKLYVLGALAQSIAAGSRTWTEQLPIQDKLKSLPSGELQDKRAGTRLALYEYAQKMIQISDNTATDHLIDLLGRGYVEEAQKELGHHNASLNVPFLTTAEVFRLKFAKDETLVSEYLEMNVSEKKRFLKDSLSNLTSLDEIDPTGKGMSPQYASLDWFATPKDICQAFVKLDELAEKNDEDNLQSILNQDQTGGVADEVWDFVGFKGGFEPGLVIGAYVYHRVDGRRFTQVLHVTDPSHLVDARAIALLATEGEWLLSEIS